MTQMSNAGFVMLTQATKKQKLPPKSTLRRFKLIRVTLGEIQTASPPWQIHQVSSWSCCWSCTSIHIRWNGYRGVQRQLESSVSPSVGSDCFSEESLAQRMKWMYFLCLLLLPLPVLDFPPLPVLLEQGGWCTDADPMAAGGSTSPQVQCQACDGETEIQKREDNWWKRKSRKK